MHMCMICIVSLLENFVSVSLVCPVVSCAGVAEGAAEAVGPDHCRIPSEPAAQKRRVTQPACVVSPRVRIYEKHTALYHSVEYLYQFASLCIRITLNFYIYF